MHDPSAVSLKEKCKTLHKEQPMIFTASEPIQFPFQWVPGFFPGAKAGEA
jgi:hypothetical protein